MHHDELIKMISEMKTQDNGFVEEINKLSKRNAELTQRIKKREAKNDSLYEEINDLLSKIRDYEHKIHELTQENDKLKTKNDSLYRELNQSSYKIRDDKHEIHQLKGMLENAMADQSQDKKAINGLEGVISGLEGKVEELLYRNDELIDENEMLKKASNLIVERHQQLIEQLTEEEDDDYHGITKYRYSYGQNKAFAAFAIANDIPESTLHKFYEAVLKLEKEFDADEPSNAEINDSCLKIKEYEHKIHELESMLTNATAKIDLLIESNGNHMNTIAVTDGESFGHKRDLMALEKKHNNLLESLEHLINCNVLNHALTTALDTEKGE